MNVIRLYRHELMKLPEYSTTLPTGTVDWKMWRADMNAFRHSNPLPDASRWQVRQYVPVEDSKRIEIRYFTVQFREDPAP